MYIMRRYAWSTVAGTKRRRYKNIVTDTENVEPYEAKLRLKFHNYRGGDDLVALDLAEQRPDPNCSDPLDPFIWTFYTRDNPRYTGPPYTSSIFAQFIRQVVEFGTPKEKILKSEEFDGGHPVRPTADHVTPDNLCVSPRDSNRRVYNAYIVDRTPPGNHGHQAWNQDPDEVISGVRFMLEGLEYRGNSPTRRIKSEHYMLDVVNLATPPINRFRLHWTNTFPTSIIEPHELMVWVCLSTNSWHNRADLRKALNAGADGATVYRSRDKTILCEVWPDRIRPGLIPRTFGWVLGKIIFHEWMHVKIDVDKPGEGIHGNPSGIGKLPIDERSSANVVDKEDMAEKLYRKWNFSQRQ